MRESKLSTDTVVSSSISAPVTKVPTRGLAPFINRMVAQTQSTRRRFRWPMIVVRMAIDAVLINIGFVVAWWARYDVELLKDLSPEFDQPLSAFWQLQLAITAVALITFNIRGLYAQPRGASLLDQIAQIAGGALTALAIVIIGSLLFSPLLPSRLIFAFALVAIVLVFAVERFAMKQLRMALWRRGINTRNALVVGSSYAGQRLMKDLMERTELGYRLAGYVEDEPEEKDWLVPMNGHGKPARLGQVLDVDKVISAGDIDEVIVALPANSHAQIMEVIERCRYNRVAFRLVPDLFEIKFNEVQIDAFNGIPLIGIKEVALQGTNLAIKRSLDIAVSALVLLITAPAMGIIALLIKLERPTGSVFFLQERVGRNGRPFMCVKFRSMRPDAELLKDQLLAYNEATGPMFKMRNDPRVTRIGKWLRRTSLDEMPQVINILRGDMSWVGPRPQIPSEVEQYQEWHRRRLETTPGLTGLWQVSGRSDLSFDDMVKLDLYYAENWSLLFDLKIILQTIPAVLKGRGAY